MTETIEAVLTMPFSNAARNATLSLLIYKTLGVPHAYLAALGVIIFSFFPLTYAWFVCTPWCLARLYSGCWYTGAAGWDTVSGILLLAFSVIQLESNQI
jgi:predicted PurR-regulated permease PerM